jgi:hypothetical protein
MWFPTDSNGTTVEEPQEDTVVDPSYQRLVGNEEELVRLELQLTDDRKKRSVLTSSSREDRPRLWGKARASGASRIA